MAGHSDAAEISVSTGQSLSHVQRPCQPGSNWDLREREGSDGPRDMHAAAAAVEPSKTEGGNLALTPHSALSAGQENVLGKGGGTLPSGRRPFNEAAGKEASAFF